MGWTLFACFGGTNKRKRPKSASKFGFKTRRRIRGYEPLQLDNSEELDAPQILGSTREKPKDETKTRIRKKVRFNLEVVTYEPLSSQEDEHDDNNWEERGDEESDQAAAAAAAAVEACLIYAPLSKTISTETKLPLYPSNYRYNCCYDGEDEYDEVEDDDDYGQLSDDDDDIDNDYEDDDGCTIDPQSTYHEKVTEELHDCSSVPLISSATNARLRSHYIVPVLNPIENLSQWKTVKTRKC